MTVVDEVAGNVAVAVDSAAGAGVGVVVDDAGALAACPSRRSDHKIAEAASESNHS